MQQLHVVNGNSDKALWEHAQLRLVLLPAASTSVDFQGWEQLFSSLRHWEWSFGLLCPTKLHGKVLNILLDSHNVAQNWFLQVQTGWLRWNSLGNGHHLTTRIFSSAHQEFKWLFYSQHIKSSLQLKQRGGPLVWTPVEHPKGIKGELSDYSTTGMEKLSLLESPHRGTA